MRHPRPGQLQRHQQSNQLQTNSSATTTSKPSTSTQSINGQPCASLDAKTEVQVKIEVQDQGTEELAPDSVTTLPTTLSATTSNQQQLPVEPNQIAFESGNEFTAKDFSEEQQKQEDQEEQEEEQEEEEKVAAEKKNDKDDAKNADEVSATDELCVHEVKFDGTKDT